MSGKRSIKPGEVVADTKQFDKHIKKIAPRSAKKPSPKPGLGAVQ